MSEQPGTEGHIPTQALDVAGILSAPLPMVLRNIEFETALLALLLEGFLSLFHETCYRTKDVDHWRLIEEADFVSLRNSTI